MFFLRARFCLATVGIIAITGCDSSKNEYKSTQQIKATAPSAHDHESHEGGHTHYGAGPHGGSLIELGGDDYHAELVLDHDAHALRVFLLKSDAKSPLPTKTSQVTFDLGKDRTLLLKANPLDGEIDGESSRFELVDKALIHDLADKGFLHGDLSVQIDGKPFKSHIDIHFEHGESKPDHKHEGEQDAK